MIEPSRRRPRALSTAFMCRRAHDEHEKLPPTSGVPPEVMGTAAAAAGITNRSAPRARRHRFPGASDTVNVAVVGFAHGMWDVEPDDVAKSDNIGPLCDCDASGRRQGR